jgi:hypothetical protein
MERCQEKIKDGLAALGVGAGSAAETLVLAVICRMRWRQGWRWMVVRRCDEPGSGRGRHRWLATGDVQRKVCMRCKAIKHRRTYLRGAFLDRPVPESVIRPIRKKLAKSSAFSLDQAHGLLHIWIIKRSWGDSSERFIYSTEKR